MLLLRSVLRAKPDLRACLTRCRHCRHFLSDPPAQLCSSAARSRCPFGCREAAPPRESHSAQRRLLQRAEGKRAKKNLNQRRCRLPPRQAQRPTTTLPKRPTRRPKPPAAKGNSVPPNPGIVQHVRMVVSLIEGRAISRRQVLLMLAKILRQHTLMRRRRIDHAVLWLKKRPP